MFFFLFNISKTQKQMFLPRLETNSNLFIIQRNYWCSYYRYRSYV